MTYANQIAFLKATRGEQVSKAYSSWLNMRRRVRSPRGKKEKCYENLSIQRSWNNFEVFLKEMGLPKLNESIDRIDNSLGYSKENCRWADATIQSRNRKCVKLNIDAVKQIKQEYFETKTTQQNLAIKYGVSQHMISCVVRNKFWATC